VICSSTPIKDCGCIGKSPLHVGSAIVTAYLIDRNRTLREECHQLTVNSASIADGNTDMAAVLVLIPRCCLISMYGYSQSAFLGVRNIFVY
jgi:hypothetical protein